MNDHEVEIYVQNESEPHMAAGVYSVLNNDWIEEPTKAEFEVDLETTKKKADQSIDQIERVYDIFESREYPKAMAAGKRLKEKIKEMRRAGLADEGVYSPENMAFKLLRRSGHIELLHKIITKSYDKIMSLDSARRKERKSVDGACRGTLYGAMLVTPFHSCRQDRGHEHRRPLQATAWSTSLLPRRRKRLARRPIHLLGHAE